VDSTIVIFLHRVVVCIVYDVCFYFDEEGVCFRQNVKAKAVDCKAKAKDLGFKTKVKTKKLALRPRPRPRPRPNITDWSGDS